MILKLANGKIARPNDLNKDYGIGVRNTTWDELADALDAANERIRALEAAPTASEELEKSIAALEGMNLTRSQSMTLIDLLRRLDRERQDFHMAYRMKCDEETKRLEAALAEAREWRRKAFLAHPNLDLDIDAAIAREGQTR